MYRPDPVIVRKIQEFDRHLFVVWNNRRHYFEIWRRGVWGRRLVLAVTRTLYEQGAPKEFAPLDERVLACLHEPWGSGDHLAWYDKQVEREFAQSREKDRQRRADARAFGLDMWQTLHQRFVTTHASKNTGRPNFNRANDYSQWVRPDVRTTSGNRLYQRSAANAKAYGYRGK